MAHVRMTHPKAAGEAEVPEAYVARAKEKGWRLADKAAAPKTPRATRASASKKKRKTAIDADDNA